jgi:pre-mRNA-splicing factor ISY1
MYFGAAKNLPGVQELLKPASTLPAFFASSLYTIHIHSTFDLFHLASEVVRKTRYELYKDIDADYYGFRDDEDGLLEKLESEAERKGHFFSIVHFSSQLSRCSV